MGGARIDAEPVEEDEAETGREESMAGERGRTLTSHDVDERPPHRFMRLNDSL